jgi:hypothetical protein
MIVERGTHTGLLARGGLYASSGTGSARPRSGAARGARTRHRRTAAHLGVHERIRLSREPQPGLGPDREDGLPRNALLITTPTARIGVVQIAGLVARRIVPFAREGQMLAAGQRIGLIRFGSRVDVYLPPGTQPLVAEGQTALAGETVLADLAPADQARSYRRE